MAVSEMPRDGRPALSPGRAQGRQGSDRVSDKSSDRRRLSILGAAGSIGHSTLDLVGRHADDFQIVALTAQRCDLIIRRLTAPAADVA